MIVLAIVITVMFFIVMASLMDYNDKRDDIAQIQEESTNVQNERVKESLNVELDMGTLLLKIDNTSGVETSVIGIKVECEDGTVHTEKFDMDISPSGDIDLATQQQIRAMMNDLEGRC